MNKVIGVHYLNDVFLLPHVLYVKLSAMTITKLPKQMQHIQALLRSLDWHAMEYDVQQELESRIVIVGPVNSGKSTLFNRLHGRKLSAVSAVPGTTTGIIEQPLGPLLLVDTPGFGEVWGVDRAATARQAASDADLILLLLDAAAGVRQTDLELFNNLRVLGVPVIVALNKSDLVKKDLPWILENIEEQLGVRPVAISARTGMGITDALLPAILVAHTPVAVAMARALPGVRKQLVNRLIRRTAWINAIISLEPVPGLDIPLLLVSQTRLVLRIAAAHGQSMSVSHARELLSTMAGSLLSRYLGIQLAKLVPGPGWIVSAAFAAISTWGIGQAANSYFLAGGNSATIDLKALYQRMRQRAPKALLRRKKTIDSTQGDGPT
ncbi:MAG: GTP-binding protein [Anaerolineae bacterium]|nr:GTP-binding protein [Anaerolineae bacterium]